MPPSWSTTEDGHAHAAVVLVDPLDEEELAAAALASGHRPVVLVTPNTGRPTYVRALLTGHGQGMLPGRGRLVRGAVDAAMAAAGRSRKRSNVVDAVATGRPLDDLLADVAANAGTHDRPWLVLRYDPIPEAPELAGPAPFLSVLVRTQGRRPDALADVLLCLLAQTCEDFELLLLAHDARTEVLADLGNQIDSMPEGFRSRVRVMPVSGGGRSRPLTIGTQAARGSYVAVLDDDDLVMSHWVETFTIGAEIAPGQVVRGIAVEQDVEHVGADPGHRAASWPRARWDPVFSLLSHIVDNHSPIHSYAYPREIFTDLGLRFDESLPVLEDWDLLVRAASLVGVHDTGQVTAVYRRWPEAASSFAELPEVLWPKTAWRIVDGWDRAPLLLPAGSALRLRREGIATLQHRTLRERVQSRLRRERDRWSPLLMRTPLFPGLRWAYRRLVPPAGEIDR
jgi:hypothetical protein